MSVRRPLVIAAALVCAACAFLVSLQPTAPVALAKPAPPSPSPSPTTAPTPYMAIEVVPNGKWDVIMQGRDISYSTMILKGVGTTVTGSWKYNKVAYIVTGTRDGSHLKLDLKASAAADAQVVGKIDATIDGIADMFGTITLNGTETPFQGAQHSRVPGPVDTTAPGPSHSPP